MLPSLVTVGPLTISSFGLFLSFSFLYATFLVWRLARAWDLNEEKVLDLLVLTFLGGFLASRVYFVIVNLEFFSLDPVKALLITKYPGLSLWGGLLGGLGILTIFAKRLKLDFLQILDITSVGLIGGLILGSLGCFLGSCDVGIESSFLGVNQVGFIGKRFPVQLFEALSLILILKHIWYKATHFHRSGQVASISLIFLGMNKLVWENLKSYTGEGYIFSVLLLVSGIYLYYFVTKRNFLKDLKLLVRNILGIIGNAQVRGDMIGKFKKSWYNQKTALSWNVKDLSRFLKRINVKLTTKNFK